MRVFFPGEVFRRSHDRLAEALGERRADLEYLRVLHLAAATKESDVAAALELLLPEQAEREGWGFERYLHHLAEVELDERARRKIEGPFRSSGLPLEKTLGRLELDWLPALVRRQVPRLCEGDFVERAENLLACGLPGRGKTHLVAAIGHELVTSNLVLSEWDKIFYDSMTTACAIDRIVHHVTILELTGDSFRPDVAAPPAAL